MPGLQATNLLRRPFQRAAEDDITSFVDCPMNANSALTKPKSIDAIKNLAQIRPVGVLKPRLYNGVRNRIGL